MGKILIFYKYAHIEYPKRILKWQQRLCQELELRGRILIAEEGINGTVGGTEEAIARYLIAVKKHPYFAGVDIKGSEGDQFNFPRMQITLKKTVVNFGRPQSVESTGIHLTPQQVHQLLEKKPDNLVVLDARNNFESAIGYFEGAIRPDIQHFRDLPDYLDEHAEFFKDKQVLMYCTAGIRCEKATAYLKDKQVAQEVYQIEGGIHRYVESYPNGFFKGKNYVFDGRIATKVTNDILSLCMLCQAACDDYINCLNATCNKHFISCASCTTTLSNCCSQACKQLVESKQVTVRPARQKTYDTNDQPLNNR